MRSVSFDWDDNKNAYNIRAHGISFISAEEAFFDPHRIIAWDKKHSTEQEKRWFCIGKVGDNVLTVRFTYRNGKIRIFGAGYWRRERKMYEEKN